MEQLFQPYSKNHSIRESVITFFLDAPIAKPKRFLDIDNGLKEDYASRRTIRLAKISFEGDVISREHTSTAQFNDEAGFVLTKFVDGKPASVLQGMNDKEKKQYFSFHTFNYEGWTKFKASFYNVMNKLDSELNNIFVIGIGLQYVDEFVWEESAAVNNTKLFNSDSPYLPKAFFEGNKSDYLLTTNNQIESLDYFARTHIRVVTDQTTRTRVTHNILFRLNEAKELVAIINDRLSKGSNKSFSEETLDKAHALNVKLMNSLLLPEISKAIGLPNTDE